MQLHTIDTGIFRLDGGAMFGVVPKPIWEKTNPADSRNRIELAMRCLLVNTGNRLVLIDNGLGTKQNDKFKLLYGLDESQTLEKSLNAAGYSKSDITDVLLTHLHFDHCGGTTELNSDGKPVLAFPNAHIWVQKRHLETATHPNAREVASFFRENIQPIADAGQLKLVDTPAGATEELIPGIKVRTFDGHTAGMQLPIVEYKGRTLLYAADLFPTHGHLPLPYVMGYDVQPLVTLAEREGILDWLVQNQVVLYYEHDPVWSCGTVTKDDRGKFGSGDLFPLTAL